MNRTALRSPTDICTRNTEGTVWPEPENTESPTLLPPVHESHPDEKKRVVTDRVLRVTSECYVTLLTTLHSLTQTPTTNHQPKDETATANGAADGHGYVVDVLNPFVEVMSR